MSTQQGQGHQALLLAQRMRNEIGWVTVFRVVVAVFAGSTTMTILAPTVTWVIAAQGLAGASAAIIVPSLVALIADTAAPSRQPPLVLLAQPGRCPESARS